MTCCRFHRKIDAYCTELVKCTVFRKYNQKQSQCAMLGHDVLLWPLMHEWTRMLAIWESHKIVRKRSLQCFVATNKPLTWISQRELTNGCNIQRFKTAEKSKYLPRCRQGYKTRYRCVVCVLQARHIIFFAFSQALVKSTACDQLPLSIVGSQTFRNVCWQLNQDFSFQGN